MFKNICWVNWLFTAMVAFLFFLSISAALTGCGNKGALYLPDTNKNTKTSDSKPTKKN